MAAEIKRARGLDAQLVKGSGGVFDVYQGETLLFSKHAEHRFPEVDEILAAAKLLGQLDQELTLALWSKP